MRRVVCLGTGLTRSGLEMGHKGGGCEREDGAFYQTGKKFEGSVWGVLRYSL
jgi:hypothetical protein